MFTIDQYLNAKKLGLPYAGKAGSPKTIASYKSSLRTAERLLNKAAFAFTDKDFAELITNAKRQGLSQATINLMIVPLRGMFDWAIGNHLHDGPNPAHSVTTSAAPRKLPKLISDRDVDTLLEKIEARGGIKYALVTELMAYSGVRISEALSLRRDSLVYAEQSNKLIGVRVIRKGNKETFVPLRPQTLERLVTYIENRDCGEYVFTSDSKVKSETPLSKTAFYDVFNPVKVEMGMSEEVTPHNLRHSFATKALRKTKRLEVVQDLLGHASPQTTRFYAQLEHDDLVDEYSKVWA